MNTFKKISYIFIALCLLGPLSFHGREKTSFPENNALRPSSRGEYRVLDKNTVLDITASSPMRRHFLRIRNTVQRELDTAQRAVDASKGKDPRALQRRKEALIALEDTERRLKDSEYSAMQPLFVTLYEIQSWIRNNGLEGHTVQYSSPRAQEFLPWECVNAIVSWLELDERNMSDGFPRPRLGRTAEAAPSELRTRAYLTTAVLNHSREIRAWAEEAGIDVTDYDWLANRFSPICTKIQTFVTMGLSSFYRPIDALPTVEWDIDRTLQERGAVRILVSGGSFGYEALTAALMVQRTLIRQGRSLRDTPVEILCEDLPDVNDVTSRGMYYEPQEVMQHLRDEGNFTNAEIANMFVRVLINGKYMMTPRDWVRSMFSYRNIDINNVADEEESVNADIITAFEVLPYAEEPERALRHYENNLREGGTLYVSLDARQEIEDVFPMDRLTLERTFHGREESSDICRAVKTPPVTTEPQVPNSTGGNT